MFKKVFVRSFVVVAALATGGVAVAAVRTTGSTTQSVPASQAVQPKTILAISATDVRAAVLNACAGRSLVPTLDAAQTAQVDRMLQERALHSASLAGNPLNSGTGFQAGVDDALHIQLLDRQLAGVLCPTP